MASDSTAIRGVLVRAEQTIANVNGLIETSFLRKDRSWVVAASYARNNRRLVKACSDIKDVQLQLILALNLESL